MDKKVTLQDLYSWPGFRAQARTTSHIFDPLAKVVELQRRQKKAFAPIVKRRYELFVHSADTWSVIWMRLEQRSMWPSNTDELNARIAKP